MATLLETRSTLYRFSRTNTPSPAGDYRVLEKVYLDSQSIANNESYCYSELYLQTYNAPISGTYSLNNEVNGVWQTNRTRSVSAGDTLNVLVGTNTYPIPHASDGTGSFTRRFRVVVSGDSWVTAYVNLYLPTIPRASVPTYSTSNVDLGNEIMITTNRASTDFTHTITYAYGTATGTIGTGVGASVAWTPSVDLANNLPNAGSGLCYISTTTYNGATQIGSTIVQTITLNVPSAIVPTCSLAVSEGGTLIPEGWNVFVKGKSKITGDITASGAYSSTISTYTNSVLGSTYYTDPFTSGYINASGSVDVVSTVRDSRNRTATDTETITVLDYGNPSITGMTIVRCNSDGTVNPTNGTYAKIVFPYAIYSVGDRNIKQYSVKYKLTSDTEYTTALSTTILTDYADTGEYVTANLFSVSLAYDVVVTLIDSFGTFDFPIQLGTGAKPISILAGGKGIAFGKVAQEDSVVEINENWGLIYRGSELLDWAYPIGSIYETTSTDLDTTTKMETL